MTDLIKKIEALLFAVGRAISEKEIADFTSVPVSEIHHTLVELRKQYEGRESPLLIIQEGEGWKLTVHEKYLPVVQQITPHTELSKAVLETLAVIAWKHPSKQSDVIKIRTNKAYEHIDELERLGFVSKEKYGRSYLIKVTQKFFDYFDLKGEKEAREIFKDVKDVEEAQTKLMDQEQSKEVGFEVYGEEEKGKEKVSKEHLGDFEVYETPEETEAAQESSEEEKFEETEAPEEKEQEKEETEEATETEEHEDTKKTDEEERELDTELEEMLKEKK